MITFYWPGAMDPVSIRGDFLAGGFRAIGAEVVMDPGLLAGIDTAFCVYPCRLEIDGHNYNIWYDVDDFPNPHHRTNTFIEAYAQWMRTPDDFYFKVQLPYWFDAARAFPMCQMTLPLCVKQTPALRRIVDEKPPVRDVAAMFRFTDHGDRAKAATAVLAHFNGRAIAKVSPRHSRPEPPAEVYRSESIPQGEYLKNLAKSKMCLSLPGVGADWCFRSMEIWAIGACMAAYPGLYKLPGNPEGIYVEVQRDQSNLIDVLEYYIAHDDKRRAIARRGRDWYDEHATAEAQAQYIVDKVTA